ncbi:AfsR/SARP family transcriptional regulator [Parafrankia sp. FMc2]|uniref:AfsR/SARP family transcriptional regulator n=1 Tax=Parafrankia sp. FMc2 TaxID=3233196 RepID=UPI0034D507D9
MQFSVLGSLAVSAHGRRSSISGRCQEALLLTLLINEGTVVAVGTLIEELWGPQAPRNARNALQAHVSRLRRELHRLEPDRPEGSIVARHGGGYRLKLAPADEIDATVFMTGLRDVRSWCHSRRDEAVARLRELLSLWCGPLSGAAVEGAMCRAAAAHYEESRLDALELLFDLELVENRHETILSEVRELAAMHPLRERFCEQLMIALYRSGRQVEALDYYHRLRRRLTGELGTGPSATLRRTAEAVLSHSPLLTVQR